MVNSFLAESVGSDGYAIKGPAAAALQAGAALIALAGDQIGFTSRPVMQMPATTPTPGQVLAWNGSSWEPSSISASTPGGTSGQLQFNNGGVFDGVTGSYVSGSDVTFAGNLSLSANKQIEFGSVGIIKQSANVIWFQSASGATFRDMAGTGYVSATAQSFYGADYVQGVQRVLVGGSSGGRLLPITDGVAVYNWAQSALGNVQASKYKATGGFNGVGYENEFTGYGTGWNNNGETVVVVNSSAKVLLGNTVIHGGSYGLTGTMGYNPTADVIYGRNATGPAAQIQAAGGLNVKDLAGTGWSNVSLNQLRFPGDAHQTYSSGYGIGVSGSNNPNITIYGQTVIFHNSYGTAGGSEQLVGIGKSYTDQGIWIRSDATYRGHLGFSPYATIGNYGGQTDARIYRGTEAIGSASLETRSTAGLKVKTQDGSADAPVTASRFNILAVEDVSSQCELSDYLSRGIIARGNDSSSTYTLFRVNYARTSENPLSVYRNRVDTTVPVNVASGTVTASTPALNVLQTWNNASVAFTGTKLNVTDTASLSTSLLADYQLNSASVLTIDKNGSIKMKASPNIGTGLGVEIRTTDSYRDISFITTATNKLLNITGDVEIGPRSGSTSKVYWGDVSSGLTPYVQASANNLLEVQNAKLLVQLNASATGNGIELKTSGGTSLFSVSVAGDAVFSSTVTSAFQTLSADPTTTDISAGNQRMVKNSTSGTLKLWANDAGTMKSVALT